MDILKFGIFLTFQPFDLFKGNMTSSGSDNCQAVTKFFIKAATQALHFSGVTTFNSLSADFESRLKPRSAAVQISSDQVKKFFFCQFVKGLVFEVWNKSHPPKSHLKNLKHLLPLSYECNLNDSQIFKYRTLF